MTDTAFRRLVKRQGGCGLVVSEMVSSEGLVRGIDRTLEYAEFTEEERPVSIQIFGGDPPKMAEAARIVEGIADVNDESAGGDTRLVIELKKDAPALVILNNLYKHTPLQTNFAVNTVALVDGVPRTLNLRDALQHYIDHQVEFITRRSEFRLKKARDRAHIVEGLLRALDMIDAIIAAVSELGVTLGDLYGGVKDKVNAKMPK